MKTTLKTHLLFLLALFVIVGCSSGGSSSGSGGAQPVEIFASWDSISPSSSVQSSSVVIVSDDETPRDEEITLDFDESATLNQFTIGSDSQEQVFERQPLLEVLGAPNLSLFKKSADAKDWLTSFNPDAENWKYQSMALWLDVSDNNIDVGALSFSSSTQQAEIPDQQNITFTGKAIGLYIDGNDNNRYLTEATITAILQSNKIELSATDTHRWAVPSFNVSDINNGFDKTRDSNLDFTTMDLQYNSSDNSFDASNVETDDAVDKLTGSVKARLYGPEAQEFGGVFRMSDGSGSSHSGAFGAKK